MRRKFSKTNDAKMQIKKTIMRLMTKITIVTIITIITIMTIIATAGYSNISIPMQNVIVN